MIIQDLVCAFRSQVSDEVKPYFWSDDMLYIYFTDAIYQYCKYGCGIRDHTSSITTIDYEASNPWIPYDEKIIKLISAFDVTNSNHKLRLMDWDEYMKMNVDHRTDDYSALSNVGRYPDHEGVIRALIFGMEEYQLRLVNIPPAKGTIQFVVERYPMEIISEEQQKIEGVPLGDRILLLEWVKHKAYLHQDAEMFDPDKAEVSRLLFLSEMSTIDSKDVIRNHRKGEASYGGI